MATGILSPESLSLMIGQAGLLPHDPRIAIGIHIPLDVSQQQLSSSPFSASSTAKRQSHISTSGMVSMQYVKHAASTLYRIEYLAAPSSLSLSLSFSIFTIRLSCYSLHCGYS